MVATALMLWTMLAHAQDPQASQAGSHAILEQVSRIQEGVAKVRERPFLRPVDAAVLDHAALAAAMERALTDELTDEEIRGMQAELAMLGLIEPATDLKRVLQAFLSAQVGGFYDPKERKLFCAEIGLASLHHMVMAHELVHALQDQYHPLEAYYDEVEHDDDRAIARHSVVEGEAEFVSSRYLAKHGGDVARDLANDGDPQAVLEFGVRNALSTIGAPQYLIDSMTFPYVRGRTFIARVVDARGMDGIARLYEEPPASTEQILHPEKYLDPERLDPPTVVVAPDLAPKLGEGWSTLFENRLGECQAEIFLRIAGDPVRGLRASLGWDGDQIRLYERASGSSRLLQWVCVLDSENDAKELVDALRRVLERRFTPRPSDDSPDGEDAAPRGESATVTMDAAKARLEARRSDGLLRSLAVRDGATVTWLLGLETGMDAEALARR